MFQYYICGNKLYSETIIKFIFKNNIYSQKQLKSMLECSYSLLLLYRFLMQKSYNRVLENMCFTVF